MLLLLEQYEKVVNEIGALKVLDGPTLLLRIKTNIKARNFEGKSDGAIYQSNVSEIM
jgi:hypothetical protein